MKKSFTILILITGCALLFTLSFWQFQRLEWKNAIINQLEQNYTSYRTTNAPLDMSDLAHFRSQEYPFGYGRIKGHLITDKTLFLGPKTNEKGIIGFHVITPIQLNDGSYILCNRGWIADTALPDLKKEDSRIIELTGVLRVPDWNRFTPENSPSNNIWTKPDILQIAKAHTIEPVWMMMLYADQSSDIKNYITPHQKTWYPRNKHKQYALFWMTMGIILTIILFLYVRRIVKATGS